MHGALTIMNRRGTASTLARLFDRSSLSLSIVTNRIPQLLFKKSVDEPHLPLLFKQEKNFLNNNKKKEEQPTGSLFFSKFLFFFMLFLFSLTPLFLCFLFEKCWLFEENEWRLLLHQKQMARTLKRRRNCRGLNNKFDRHHIRMACLLAPAIGLYPVRLPLADR